MDRILDPLLSAIVPHSRVKSGFEMMGWRNSRLTKKAMEIFDFPDQTGFFQWVTLRNEARREAKRQSMENDRLRFILRRTRRRAVLCVVQNVTASCQRLVTVLFSDLIRSGINSLLVCAIFFVE